jgi:hypothetical protein
VVTSPSDAARPSTGSHAALTLRGERPLLAANVLALVVLAKGAALLPGYSFDDYSILSRGSGTLATKIRFGRGGWGVLAELLTALGADAHFAPMPFVVLMLLSWAALGVLLVRHWGLGRRGWAPVAVGVMAATHPYTTEILTFRGALGSAATSLALFTLLLIPRRWSGRHLLMGSALFALAMSIYQVALHFALMTVLGGAAVWLARWRGRRAPPGKEPRQASWLRFIHHRQVGLLVCTVAGTLTYVVVSAVLLVALHRSAAPRTELLAPSELPERASIVAQQLAVRLAGHDAMLPLFTKSLLLLLVICAIVELVRRARPWRRPRGLAVVAGVLLLLSLATVWTLGVELVTKEFWPAPRIMSHTGVLWAALLAIAYACSRVVGRRLLPLLVVPVVISFIGVDNHILGDQQRLNARDTAKAIRIVEQLESEPGFGQLRELTVVGGSYAYSVPLATIDHDMNISAFAAQWAKDGILREVSGYDFRPATAAQVEIAKAYCAKVQPWPAEQGIEIVDSLGIVCLAP